ncbi:MAG: nitrous oxide reductase accessory protein NosL [Haliscomenobacter sp.]|nr:hypothetical protein [Haliscomenobacter sp.]MBK9488188.1 nitrous oxide reductase accessory protein NosL [Haliscomenobacter sp.]
MDDRFAAELVTTKGKVYKFDDLFCLDKYYRMQGSQEADYGHILVNDYNEEGALIDLRKAALLKAEGLRSPMGGNIAAFSSLEKLNEIQAEKDWKRWKAKKVTRMLRKTVARRTQLV